MNKHVNGDEFDFLIGKKIIKVEEGTIAKLVCDDGTEIEIETNEGCGGCSNGWSSIDDLKILENNNNAITNVECKYSEEPGWYDNDRFTLFIYYEDGKINEIKGDDGYGNGWYGGGFYITIKNKGE